MSESEGKKRASRNEDAPASTSDAKAMDKKRPRSAEDQADDSEAIERAVYDGMQDLRSEKPK